MRKTLEKFNQLINNLLKDEAQRPVADHIPSEELYQTLDLSLNKDGISDEEFEKILKDIVFKTPRTATTGFFNQLFGGRNEKAVLGDLLAVTLNNSMYTYKAAGPQIGVEKVILREVCNIIGWDSNSDGAFAPGGSMTNYMSMVMARDAFDAEIRHKGSNQKMTVYTSAESHYSIPKNAAFSGIGRDNVRYISTDEFGKIKIGELKTQVEEDVANGFTPIMVNLTAGTTVLGAFDSIPEVREICDANNMWLHVDGAYCGAVLFSQKYKHLIDGIEKVDSFSFNAHKMIGTPLSCSIIVAKDKMSLQHSFSNDASYLYQTDHDEFNPGKTSLQCGRRNDALKFWTLWKSVGTEGLERIVDHQFYLADVARDYIRSKEDYMLYSYDDSISICFNYKGIPARTICTALYEHSKLMVGYGSFRDDEFIRLVTINAQNTKEDILNFFKTMETFVEEHNTLFDTKVQSI
ncbi:MAG: aminotransferase class V-fold PLP-dependent enzyme [Crocinitomicaceae bacterium]|nr:aminotransferase class V-fold PLP-dependent enzyme [Crocinitomicaceae bacterium]